MRITYLDLKVKWLSITGLEPKRKQSGCSKPKDKVSCEGSKYLRTALFNGMLAVISANPHWNAYYHKIESKKGYKIANCCVSKKVLSCIYYITKNDVDFDPVRSRAGWGNIA